MQNEQKNYVQVEHKPCTKKAFDCEGKFEIKIIPTYSCDMKCSFCYGKYINKEFFEPNREKVISTLSRLLAKPDINAVVEIIGGDPLSKVNFPETKALIKYLNSLDRNVKIIVQTAGHDTEKIKELIPGIDSLSYSIDLTDSPKMRNLENLEILTAACKEHGVVVQIQTMLSPKDSLEDIFRHIKRCIAAGVQYIGIEYPQYQNYTKEEMDRQIEVYTEIYKHLDDFKGISFGGIIESATDFFKRSFYSSPCMCGERSVVIEPDGSVVPSFHFGLKKLSFEEFVQAKSDREKRLVEGNCAGCELWGVCCGGCMEHSKFITGDLYSHDTEYCYLLKGLIKNLKLIEEQAK